MSTWPFVLLAFLGGMAVALQGSANAALGQRIGLHVALFTSTTVVWLFCIAFYLSKGGGALHASGVPATLYIGGFCGFLIITAAALAFPRIGPAASLALFVAGQGVTALLLEHFGWLGTQRVEMQPSRLIGIVCVIVGAFLLRR